MDADYWGAHDILEVRILKRSVLGTRVRAERLWHTLLPFPSSMIGVSLCDIDWWHATLPRTISEARLKHPSFNLGTLSPGQLPLPFITTRLPE